VHNSVYAHLARYQQRTGYGNVKTVL